MLRTTLLLLTVLLVLIGCGGGGGSSKTVKGRSIQVIWPARSRDVAQAPGSALSVKITLVAADSAGNDIVLTENRESRTDTYTGSYPIPGNIKKSASVIHIDFYSLADAGGEVVATASADFDSKQPNITISNAVGNLKVASVSVLPATVVFGTPKQLEFTARDGVGTIIALTPGSATWNQTSGTSAFSITGDGIATALSIGTGKVIATVDGIDSPEANVTVIANVSHVFHFSQATDTIQLKGGALDGGVSLGAAFTVEAYVRPTQNDGFIWQQYTDGDMSDVLDLTGPNIRAIATGSGKPVSSFVGDPLNINAWNHVAWVYDGTNVRVYQNGVLILTEAKSSDFAPIVVAQAAALGKNGGVHFSNPDVSFKGDLAWFKVSNTVRYTGSTYVQPTSAGSADGSTLLLIDASSFDSAPTTFSAPGIQNIVANLGVGNGASTSPTWVAP